MRDRNSPSGCNSIKTESAIHGPLWQKFHGGYFSDAAVAKPFLDIVQEAVYSSTPDVIVDVGGGTGFILQELIGRSIDPGIRLVNVDLSGKQLDAVSHGRIFRIRLSMNEFNRKEIHSEQDCFLFIMRSVLHYCGREGLLPLLLHLRSQMRKDEFFVHQTACFELVRDARCLNRLYELMGTGKWYPTIKNLFRLLDKAGWVMKSVVPAPALLLTSSDLGRRYGLRKYQLEEIRYELSEHFGEKENIFELTPHGFLVYLHYRIFTCLAR